MSSDLNKIIIAIMDIHHPGKFYGACFGIINRLPLCRLQRHVSCCNSMGVCGIVSGLSLPLFAALPGNTIDFSTFPCRDIGLYTSEPS